MTSPYLFETKELAENEVLNYLNSMYDVDYVLINFNSYGVIRSGKRRYEFIFIKAVFKRFLK